MSLSRRGFRVTHVGVVAFALLLSVLWVLGNAGQAYPESTDGGRGVSVLKRRKGAPVHLG